MLFMEGSFVNGLETDETVEPIMNAYSFTQE